MCTGGDHSARVVRSCDFPEWDEKILAKLVALATIAVNVEPESEAVATVELVIMVWITMLWEGQVRVLYTPKT